MLFIYPEFVCNSLKWRKGKQPGTIKCRARIWGNAVTTHPVCTCFVLCALANTRLNELTENCRTVGLVYRCNVRGNTKARVGCLGHLYEPSGGPPVALCHKVPTPPPLSSSVSAWLPSGAWFHDSFPRRKPLAYCRSHGWSAVLHRLNEAKGHLHCPRERIQMANSWPFQYRLLPVCVVGLLSIMGFLHHVLNVRSKIQIYRKATFAHLAVPLQGDERDVAPISIALDVSFTLHLEEAVLVLAHTVPLRIFLHGRRDHKDFVRKVCTYSQFKNNLQHHKRSFTVESYTARTITLIWEPESQPSGDDPHKGKGLAVHTLSEVSRILRLRY